MRSLSSKVKVAPGFRTEYAATSSSTPSARRKGTTAGTNDSPTISGGRLPPSNIVTARPPRARKLARAAPAGPPPRIATLRISPRGMGADCNRAGAAERALPARCGFETLGAHAGLDPGEPRGADPSHPARRSASGVERFHADIEPDRGRPRLARGDAADALDRGEHRRLGGREPAHAREPRERRDARGLRP